MMKPRKLERGSIELTEPSKRLPPSRPANLRGLSCPVATGRFFRVFTQSRAVGGIWTFCAKATPKCKALSPQRTANLALLFLIFKPGDVRFSQDHCITGIESGFFYSWRFGIVNKRTITRILINYRDAPFAHADPDMPLRNARIGNDDLRQRGVAPDAGAFSGHIKLLAGKRTGNKLDRSEVDGRCIAVGLNCYGRSQIHSAVMVYCRGGRGRNGRGHRAR